MQLSKNDGHFNLMAVVKWKTPGFEINDLGYMQEADEMLSVLWAGYNVWDPKGIYRSWNINGDVFMVNNFGGDITAKGIEWNGNMGFKNYWNAWTGGNVQSSVLSSGTLRGGPMMKLPGNISGRAGFSTDYRKKLTFSYYLNGSAGFENNSNSLYTEIEIEYKPLNSLSLEVVPAFSKSFSELQYVTRINNGGDKYIFASIDRKTISASLRVNYNITPDLTLQYWGQPYIATGKYYDHKVILDSRACNFRDRFWTFTPDQKEYDPVSNLYTIDSDNNGTADYSFANTSFNYQFFLSNLVIRWEYNPGSTVFLVWSQSRNFSNGSGQMDFFNDLGDLFSRENDIPHNVFLIKFSYRFGLK
jgi:hypothetical protein